jgi:hypothetical protein
LENERNKIKSQATLRGETQAPARHKESHRQRGRGDRTPNLAQYFSIIFPQRLQDTTKRDEAPTPPPRGPGSRHLSLHHSCRCNIGFLLAEQATYELPLLSLFFHGHVLSCVLEYFCRLDNAPCRWAAAMRVATLVRCHCWSRICNPCCWPWGHLSCCLPCWTKPPGKETYRSSPRLGE